MAEEGRLALDNLSRVLSLARGDQDHLDQDRLELSMIVGNVLRQVE